MNKEMLIKEMEEKYDGKMVELDVKIPGWLLEDIDEWFEPLLIYTSKDNYRPFFIERDNQNKWKICQDKTKLKQPLTRRELYNISKKECEGRHSFTLNSYIKTNIKLNLKDELEKHYYLAILDFIRSPNLAVKSLQDKKSLYFKALELHYKYIDKNNYPIKELIKVHETNDYKKIDEVIKTVASNKEWTQLVHSNYHLISKYNIV